MKEDTWWKLIAGIGLVTLSLFLYLIHFLIFQDAHHIFIFLVSDLAFIPIEVLIVTLIIDQMLEARERQQRIEKLNMVVGTFFSTLGTPLLDLLAGSDPDIGTLRGRLVVRDSWNKNDFEKMKTDIRAYSCRVDIDRIDLYTTRDILVKNEDFMLRLVENPMVFEHESFTDLILAISHLTEELKARNNLTGLPEEDTGHLANDVKRVYFRLIPEWLRYMSYLQGNYPYLVHLAMRKNPFDSSASVVIGRAE